MPKGLKFIIYFQIPNLTKQLPSESIEKYIHLYLNNVPGLFYILCGYCFHTFSITKDLKKPCSTLEYISDKKVEVVTKILLLYYLPL